jgi:gluconolactonase
MAFDMRDERFHDVIAPEARIETVVGGLGITEGTVWHPREQCLVFSDLSAGKVYRWEEGKGAAVLRMPSNITNGNYIDRQGRVISCEHATSCVVRFEPRFVRVIASHYQGREFNSPNDIVCDSRGRIWFSDPLFGRTNPRVAVLREPQLGFQGVFRLETDGAVTLVADDFDEPNGLCLSPGEDALYVDDTHRGHIRRFELRADGSVTGGEEFATVQGEGIGKPDGLKVDIQGRVYCTGPGGIHVFTAQGELLGVITTPAKTRNFCFGGPDGRTLYLAMDQAIGRVAMKVAGVLPTLE